ncbi:MAG: DUF4139 domain-containing protein [Candidatus Eremiobacteraeota bacterium]|nr:DUF4139 domain-containing protein [Candidatus Eremiobacteraeota bacterium]
MKRISLVLVFILSLAPLRSLAVVQERASTLADRQAVNLTIYNDGTALIHDRRRVSLNAGLNRIAWRDVSASMDPTSAVLDALGSGARVSVLEQNFDYDVLSQASLLSKYVGRDVTVVHPAQFAGDRERRETARILSVDGGIVLQYRDRVETTLDGRIEFPAIPSSLRDRPTLALDLETPNSGSQVLDLQYLTNGLSWSVAYIGSLSRDESRMNLTGLVTLTNSSGTSYPDARLQLVAGNPHISTLQFAKGEVQPGTTADVYSVGAVRQEDYFVYHLYTVGHPTTVLDKQTKQLTLLSARDVPVTKTLELRGEPSYYRRADADLGDRLPVSVYVSFVNRGGDLGIPLPAGAVRVYENDSRGLSQYLGSDDIGHTPRNDTVRLQLGDSFDLVARKRQTNFQWLSSCRTASSYEIDFVNGKDAPQDVLVVEPIPGDWSISEESQPHTKSSASTATWTVHVPADGRTKLTYTSNVSWCR